MEADVSLPSMSFNLFCQTGYLHCHSQNNMISKVLIRFSPKYTLDDKGRGEIYSDL
jgi:hypothetical protein